jgi:outer membrane protein assembly factor BamD (BamD/ComL family)
MMDRTHGKREANRTPKSGKPEPAQTESLGLYGPVLRLQQVIGNQAVQGLLNQRAVIPVGANRMHIAARSGTPDISREDDPAAMARQHFEEGAQLYSAGQYAAAIPRFERARQVPTLDAETYTRLIWNLAMCNFRLERFATAVFYFEQYLSRGVSEADRVAAENYLNQARAGTAGDAERILEREDADVPAATGDAAADATRARALFDQAATLYEAGQYRQAIIIFEQLREMPDMPEEVRRDTIFNIARCNMRLNRFATAIPYLEQYLQMPGASRAEAVALLTESQEAAGALTSAEQARLIYRLATEAYRASQYREAERLFQLMLANPSLETSSMADIRYNLGMALLRQGRHADALPHFQAYAAEHPEAADVQERIAECEAAIGAAVPAAE